MVINRIINLTPHQINFQFDDGKRMSFPSEGLARVDTISGVPTILVFNGREMPVASTIVYGKVEGLPEYKEGVVYIVSQIVLTHPSVVGRKDVVAPGTGPRDGAVRFPNGPQQGLIDAVTCWVAA